MDMSGEQRIPAPRPLVWQALNDPDVLKACIPGCQDLVRVSDTQMSAQVLMKVGPVRAQFAGDVTLTDLDPPAGYRIIGEGQGGIAGFAKGEAWVRLEEAGDETILRYEVKAQIGGKLAQLGARLIDVTAKQMSSAFFTRFAAEVASKVSAKAGNLAPDAGDAGPRAGPARASSGEDQAHPIRPKARATPGWLKGLTALAVLVLGLACFLSGALLAQADHRVSLSPEFVAALFLLLTSAAAYAIGYMHAKWE